MASYRSPMSLSIYLLQLFCIYLALISALFEDQVGKFDWKQEYIGKPQHFQILTGSRKIVVSTEHNVLASLAPRNGETVWRQLHENGPVGEIESLVEDDDQVWTITNNGGVVRNWDVNNGYLVSEKAIAVTEPVNIVKSYHQLINDNSQLMRMEILLEQGVQLSTYNITSGEMIWMHVVPSSWNIKSISCNFVSMKMFACVDHVTNFLHTLPTDREQQMFLITPIASLVSTPIGKVSIVTLPGVLSKSRSLVALKVNKGMHLILKVEKDTVKVIKSLDQMLTVDVIETTAGLLLFGVSQAEKRNDFHFHVVNLDTGEDLSNIMASITVPQYHGKPEKMWIYSVPKKEGGVAYRSLMVFEDHAVLLAQNSGKVLWTKEESLASVVNVEMVDLPLSDSDAQFEQEFRSGTANIFAMFIKRITAQLLQLETFLMTVLSGLQPKESRETNGIGGLQLTRDEFNLHKIILLLTKPGKIFGMDSFTGQIIWQQYIPDMAPFKNKDGPKLLLHIQRTTAYFPHHPQGIVVGKHKVTGNGLLFPFHPISGMPLSNECVHLNFQILQAMVLPQADEDYLRPLLFLDQNKKVHIYPSSGFKVAKSLSKSLFLFSAEVDSGLLTGYSISYSTPKELKATPMWEVHFPSSVQTMTHVILKRPQEHVHSQGRVMGDRSVMYKYLNPNLAAVLTKGEDSQLKPFFNIFLLDAVTGNIIYSASHKRCRGPVHVVHSENWIVYSYHSEKSRRTEMAVLELYEGKWQSNSTAFSSLHPPQSPMVERQAYIFPPGLTTAAVTLTEKGITSKFLLFALPSGRLLELPKALLDPRRPLVPTQEHREEGIYPYTPELPVPSESIINYNQSIYNIREIYTAAAGLESTCLILAFGLDLFYTRVTPSRTFDVLKDDFDHYLISAMLLALIFASYLTRRLAARKALHQAWK